MAQSHDDNGNLTGDGRLAYDWDALNRLRRVREAAAGGVRAVYLYDALGRRVRKDLPGEAADMDVTHLDWQELEFRAAGDGTLQRQFVYGAFIDEPLAMDTNRDADATCTGPADRRLFYHRNTLYSIYALTDAAGHRLGLV